MNISVIIPTLDNPDNVLNAIEALNKQDVFPKEIVIIDSSSKDDINELVKSHDSKIEITYRRVGRAYPFDRLLKILNKFPFINMLGLINKKGRAFPYEATNYGVSVARHEWVALLDATTIPDNNWIKDYIKFIERDGFDVVLGNTVYLAKTYFQKVLRASSFGANGIETSPGSLIRKIDYLNGFKITEGVRSGGDVQWKNRVKQNFNSYTPNKPYLVYPDLPKKIFPIAKKFFIYSMYTAVQDIAHSIKDLYLLAILFFTLILIPKWNAIVGWEASPLYFPHITKIWLISITLILLFSLAYNRLILSKSEASILRNIHKITIFVIISFVVYNWNGYFASWVEDSVWYIPHITKIYVSIICLVSFLYRAFYYPLKYNISIKFLLPINWLVVGLVGFLLDIVKAPGYLLGTIISPVIKMGRN